MRFDEKVKKAREIIKKMEETGEDPKVTERLRSLLRFTLAYADQGRMRKAHYRIDKILQYDFLAGGRVWVPNV